MWDKGAGNHSLLSMMSHTWSLQHLNSNVSCERRETYSTSKRHCGLESDPAQQLSQKSRDRRRAKLQGTKSMCMLKCSYLANVKSKLPDNGSSSTVWHKLRKFKTSELSGFEIPLSWMSYLCQSVVLNKILWCILKNNTGVPEKCCSWDTLKNGIWLLLSMSTLNSIL